MEHKTRHQAVLAVDPHKVHETIGGLAHLTDRMGQGNIERHLAGSAMPAHNAKTTYPPQQPGFFTGKPDPHQRITTVPAHNHPAVTQPPPPQTPPSAASSPSAAAHLKMQRRALGPAARDQAWRHLLQTRLCAAPTAGRGRCGRWQTVAAVLEGRCSGRGSRSWRVGRWQHHPHCWVQGPCEEG
jgi:hypothetical protein